MLVRREPDDFAAQEAALYVSKPCWLDENTAPRVTTSGTGRVSKPCWLDENMRQTSFCTLISGEFLNHAG